MSEDEDSGTNSIWLSVRVSHIELSHKDCHINLGQELLRRQFKDLSGLQSTLWLTKLKEPQPPTGSVQVLHSWENNWIVASTVECSGGEVNVFGSLYSSVDTQEHLTCSNIFLEFISRSSWRDVPSKLSVETVDYSQLLTVQPSHMVAIIAMSVITKIPCDSTCSTALSHSILHHS